MACCYLSWRKSWSAEMCPECLESEDGGQAEGAAADGCHVEGGGGASAKQVTFIWLQVYKIIYR